MGKHESGSTKTKRWKLGSLNFWIKATSLFISLIVVCIFVFTGSVPVTDARPPPTAQQVGAAREAVLQLRASSGVSNEANLVGLGPDHLDGLSALATYGFRPDRLDVFIYKSRLYIHASHKLPFGRWLNVTIETIGNRGGFPSLRIKIGQVQFSPNISRLLIDALRSLMRLIGANIPPLDELIHQFAVQDDRIFAKIKLPDKMGMLDSVLGAQSSVNPTLVVEAYCQLATAQQLNPQSDLAVQIRRAFPIERVASATPDRNGAAFVALAMAIVDKRVGSMVGVGASKVSACQMPASRIMLHGRDDLPKHWALSAALSVGPGTQIAAAMGEWKELADSLNKQSKFQLGDPTGFSFIDIAADRSGFRTAEAASDKALATKIASRLSMAIETEILPRPLLTLEEGPDVEFVSKYGTINDPRFIEAVRNIDLVLDQHGLTRP